MADEQSSAGENVALTLARGPSLTEQAAESIRSRIVRGVLQCGEPLSEIALAQELGVSKTPVREALIQLKRQGLVEIHPQRGTFVFEMNAAEVRDLAEMQAAASAGDAEAYRVLDGAFHDAIVDAAGNAFLTDAFTGIAFRIQALRSRLSLDPSLNISSLDEHVQLLDMVRNKRSKKAADLLQSHIEGTRDRYLAVLGGFGAGEDAGARPG